MTLCGGILLSAVGIINAVDSCLETMLEMCPVLLTSAVSTARIRPYLPPWTTTRCGESGIVTSKVPERTALYLSFQKKKKRQDAR